VKTIANDTNECGQLDDLSLSETVFPEEISNSVKAIGEEDLVAGNYKIEDVILPMPGSRVIYPLNEIGKIFHDLAKKDGISLTESVHSVKEFSITSMTGGYRRVFQKPMDFEWELLKYTDGDIPLVETDLDIIANSRPATVVRKEASSFSSNNDKAADGDRVEVAQNPTDGFSNAEEAKMALQLSFTLPSSCYATMAIRELLKTSTSVAFHKTLNR